MKRTFDLNTWSDVTQHMRLGEILLEMGKIDLKQLGIALDVQKFQDIMLGEILISMGVLTKEGLEEILKLQKNIDEMLNK